jgi:sulfite reductase (NADPH) hemoprotein beta-component
LSSRGDQFGWKQDRHVNWHLTLFIPEGRVRDNGVAKTLSGLRALAKIHKGDFRLTANQNLIVSGIRAQDRPAVEKLLDEYGIQRLQSISPLKQQALACVAFPTCGLAMAEAERYLPDFLGRVEALLDAHGLGEEPISLRITGCPNGCARPYLAEIALVGKAPGRYNLFLGGDALGHRLNRLARENIDEAQILESLDGLFAQFAASRSGGESFGDFSNRTATFVEAA